MDREDSGRTFRGILAAAFGPEDVPAVDFFPLIAATSGKGMGLARRGMIHLMGGLAKSIRDRGGEVWTRASATGIALDGNRTTGVQVEPSLFEAPAHQALDAFCFSCREDVAQFDDAICSREDLFEGLRLVQVDPCPLRVRGRACVKRCRKQRQ